MRAETVLPDSVNQAELGGLTIRKGTVAAFLANARVLADPAAAPALRQEAERDIVEALPALRAFGLFEVLAVRDTRVQAFIDAQAPSGPL